MIFSVKLHNTSLCNWSQGMPQTFDNYLDSSFPQVKSKKHILQKPQKVPGKSLRDSNGRLFKR